LIADADVRPSDVVAHDDDDVWLLPRRRGLCLCLFNTRTQSRRGRECRVPASSMLRRLIVLFVGCAPILCPFESRVMGVGPQIGYILPVAGMQGYVNLKGYGEFNHDNRPDGWNVWLTFVLSPAPPSSQSSSPPMVTKSAMRN
jgi:hypothetical protein